VVRDLQSSLNPRGNKNTSYLSDVAVIVLYLTNLGLGQLNVSDLPVCVSNVSDTIRNLFIDKWRPIDLSVAECNMHGDGEKKRGYSQFLLKFKQR